MSHTVVYYTDATDLGGAEQVLFTLLKGLDKNVWNPILVYHPSPGISQFITRLEKQKIKTMSTPEIRSYRDIDHIMLLSSKLRAISPAIFHANLNWPLSCSYGIIAAYLARAKIIIATQHLYSEVKWRRGRIEQRMISYLVDSYIAVSYDVARQLREIITSENKVEVVHNGIILENYSNRLRNTPGNDVYGPIRQNRENYPIVLTVARLDKQKGHTYLLKAAAEIPETLFVFVGDGPERANLENEAQDLRIDDRVIFLGMRYDIPELLYGCDLFVLPSLYEGLPLSIMEAMAAEKPVIAPDIGGVNELIINGETGLLVPPANPSALASSIRFVISSPDSACKMTGAGKIRIAQEFSAGKMLAKITDIYHSQISNRGDIHKRTSTEYSA